MSKVKSSALHRYASEFEDFKTDGQVLYCKCCEVAVTATKKFQVQQHIQTAKHIKNKNSKSKNINQQLIQQSFSKPGPGISQFNRDLCKAFISADIPLAKLKNTELVHFLEKYTKQHVPDESTIRKNYVPVEYELILNKLREKVGNNCIWISLDETEDVNQRCVANFVVGILGVEEEVGKSYLLHMAVLDKVNHSTVAGFFNDCLHLLWPSGILYENVLLVCTDAATYMCKAIVGLQILYPKMIHVTCLAHGLHRVCELVRDVFPDVNSLISLVKKIFLKARNRRQKFLEVAAGIPLPPSPVITRWGTWLHAAKYYADNFEIIKKVVMELDPEEAQSIKEAQLLLNKGGIAEHLIFIRGNLNNLQQGIKSLETQGLSLKTSIAIVENIVKELSDLEMTAFSEKLNNVLNKNTGYQQLKKISGVLQHDAVLDGVLSNTYTVSDIVKFSHVPIVSCDVERIFSKYKTLLADNRRKFLFEHLLQHVVIMCNQHL